MIVRGRVDHKEAGETKLVAQEVEAFEPTPEEVELRAAEMAAPRPVVRRLTLHVSPGVPESFLEELRTWWATTPGDHELLLARRRAAPAARARLPGVREQRLLQSELAALRGAARVVA